MMRPMKRISILALALALGTFGCDKGKDKKSTEAPAATQGSAATESPTTDSPTTDNPVIAAPARAKPTLKLLEAGAEPRTTLRYRFEPGVKSKMNMTMETELSGTGMPAMKVPTMKMLMDVEVAERLSDSESRYSFTLTETEVLDGPGVMPGVAEMTKKALETAKGLTGSAIVDGQGFTRDSTVKLPDGINPQMKSMMSGTMQGLDQLSSPLPQEPVGIGARWELGQLIEQNGMEVSQTTVFELIEFAGTKGKLKATVSQTAPRQKVKSGMPAGASAELIKLNSTGSGEISFDLTALVPTSKMSLVSDYTIEATSGGQNQTIDAHLAMTISIGQ